MIEIAPGLMRKVAGPTPEEWHADIQRKLQIVRECEPAPLDEKRFCIPFRVTERKS
jgi:hypothetical protein